MAPEAAHNESLADKVQEAKQNFKDWLKDLGEKAGGKRVDLSKEVLESAEIKAVFEHMFNSGEHTDTGVEGDKLSALDKAKMYSLIGGVDRVGHAEKSREKMIVEVRNDDVASEDDMENVNWYQAKSEAAELFNLLKGHIDYSSFGLSADQQAKVENIIDHIYIMTDYTDAGWNKIIAENHFSKNDVYGEKGALNILLAFQRATVGIPPEELLNKNFEPGPNGEQPMFPGKITLKLGKEGGDRPKDRYALLLEMAKNAGKKLEEAQKKVEVTEEDPGRAIDKIFEKILKGTGFESSVVVYPVGDKYGNAMLAYKGKPTGYFLWLNAKDIDAASKMDATSPGSTCFSIDKGGKDGVGKTTDTLETKLGIIRKEITGNEDETSPEAMYEAYNKVFKNILRDTGFDMNGAEYRPKDKTAVTGLMYNGKPTGYFLWLFDKDLKAAKTMMSTSPESTCFVVSDHDGHSMGEKELGKKQSPLIDKLAYIKKAIEDADLTLADVLPPVPTETKSETQPETQPEAAEDEPNWGVTAPEVVDEPEVVEETPEVVEAPKQKVVEKPLEGLDALKANGFDVVKQVGDQAYCKYGEARVMVKPLPDGRYDFNLLTLPKGQDPVKGQGVDIIQMKTALDAAKELVDKMKVMRLDLENYAKLPTTLVPLTGKDLEGNDYDPNTYRVTIEDYRFTNAKNEISDPEVLSVEVTLDERKGYTGYTEGGMALQENKDVNTFLAAALKRAYQENKTGL